MKLSDKSAPGTPASGQAPLPVLPRKARDYGIIVDPGKYILDMHIVNFYNLRADSGFFTAPEKDAGPGPSRRLGYRQPCRDCLFIPIKFSAL
jgi:hypothetical protein